MNARCGPGDFDMDGDKFYGLTMFSEAIVAGGPWEARFIFCGRHGVSPDKVRVESLYRCPVGTAEYWCTINYQGYTVAQ